MSDAYSGCIVRMLLLGTFLSFIPITLTENVNSLLCCLLLSLCLARGASCLPYTHELSAGSYECEVLARQTVFISLSRSISRILLTASIWLNSWWCICEPLLLVFPLVNTWEAVCSQDLYRCKSS